MFMSWASSPRSLQGVLGLNRFNRDARQRERDQNKESLCNKISYAGGIATLASILWIWALIVHDIYKRPITGGTKLFWICLATIVTAFVFWIVLYITVTLCRTRRRASADLQQQNLNQQQGDHQQEQEPKHHHHHHHLHQDHMDAQHIQSPV